MTLENKIKEFFNLGDYQEFYQLAVTPKLCGGDDNFKLLALLGDRVLNLELYEILIKEGITDSGSLTQRLNNYIHNEDILYSVGKILDIDKIMIPTNPNQGITKDQVKESVEALIGANFKAHGYGPHKELIRDLYKIIKNIEKEIQSKKESQLLYENPKGKVLEIFQKFGFVLPVFKSQKTGGLEHLPIYTCTLTGRFFDKEIKYISGPFSNKRDAEKNVAVKFLIRIEGDSDLSLKVKPEKTEIYKIEPKSHKTIPDEITLLKMSGIQENVKLNSLDNESLYEWAKRKATKNPFRMLLLLALRIDNLNGISWQTDVTNGNFILSFNNFNGKDYYEVGFGQSKTQAKKSAARKFIRDSNLFEWLEANHR